MFNFLSKIRISPVLKNISRPETKLIGRWRNDMQKKEKIILLHHANLDNSGAVECKKIENYKIKNVQ